MVNLLSRLSLSHKFMIIAVVGIIALGTAMATFASQDVLPGSSPHKPSGAGLAVAQEPSETPTVTETPTGTSEPTATGTPSPTATEIPAPGDAETPSPTPTASETPSPTPTATETPTGTGTPADATQTPSPTPTPANGRRDVVGIPDDNPSHQPDDGDGVCEKGETVIKITPSGNLVNVPCHSVEHGPPSFSHGHGHGGTDDASGDAD